MQVLMIGNDRNYLGFLSKKLTESALVTRECDTLESAAGILSTGTFDVIICCLPLLSKSCPFEAVGQLQQSANGAAIIIISDNIQLHTAMELMRGGLYSCFNRPFPLEQLMQTLNQIKVSIHGREEIPVLEKSPKDRIVLSQYSYVKGVSNVASQMYQQIDLVGPTSFSVIIYGETGTGKESVAREVAKSQSETAPYIAVDCGCLSKELALSELFGHEKGSFTGAIARKIGAFELANNGTLFLDEIGNLDYEVQGFLLRAIQERKIHRVGGTEDIPVTTRIIVASNENLATAVKNGKFREDLYHRLNEFEIVVPPLRYRNEDLPLFIEQFLAETNVELDKNVQTPDEAALNALLHYNWPGNIRELKNVIRRACLLCPDQTAINTDCLPTEVLQNESEQHAGEEEEDAMYARHKKPRDISLKEIEEALKISNYNKSKAAHYLGIDRKTLYNRLKTAQI
ncbi:MAG: sigma-54-dependent Fis family transcriptional regulator [Taibaiella sp.]|nr:sigma-54-dependent Fis family transcriptional regulator [Taibaiella sp.]